MKRLVWGLLILLLVACSEPSLREQLADTRGELENTRSQLAELEAGLAEAQAEAEALRAQAATLDAASTVLPAGEETELLRERLEETEAQTAAFVEEQEALRREFERAQGEVTDLRETVLRIERERNELQDTLAAREAALTAARADLERFEGFDVEELNATRIELEAARNQIRALEAELNTLREERETLREQLASFERTFADAQEETASLREQLNALEEELAAARLELSTMPSEERLEAALAERDNALAQVSVLESQLAELRSASVAQERVTTIGPAPGTPAYAQLQARFQAARARIMELEAQLRNQ